MSKNSRRKSSRKAQRQSSHLLSYLLAGGLVVVLMVVVVLVVQSNAQTPATVALMGTPVPITSRDHIPSDTNPNPYNSNPPAGGHHFDTPFPAKFYNESDVASLPKYPEGYLLHNLEHGYVIFWYNCAVPGTDCAALKQSIQNVMNQYGGTKLIGFPWPSLTVPLAMSSWGQVMNFPKVDEALMGKFVQTNRYQAPEPNAQ